MAPETCVNHPARGAVARCKRCHAAVCIDCRVKAPDGLFCSDDCVQQFREFQSRVIGPGTRRGCGFSLFAWIKHLVIVAVLVGIIWIVLTTWLGTTDIGEMGRRLSAMFKLML